MKKLLFFIFSLSFLLLNAGKVLAINDSDVWRVKDFEMQVAPVAGEEKIEFTEIIETYFDPDVIEQYNLEKHGIFRYIPVFLPTNSGWFAFKHFYSDFSVENGSGQAWPYTQTFRNDLNSNFLRIGDANKLIEGKQVYEISYTVQNPWRYFDDHDEFYWNITGNDWPVKIEDARLVFDMRDLDLHGSDIDFVCYTGAFGDTASDCVGAWDKTKQILTISTTDVLSTYEGLTVAISIPKNVVFEPNVFTKIWRFVLSNKLFFLIILEILLFIWAWFKWGKDKKSNRPLMVQYLPADKLPPAMAAYLYRLGPKSLDITSEIIWLAVHKYIKIREVKQEVLKVFKATDYNLTLLKENYDADTKLRAYQILLLDKLFDGKNEILLGDLKNKFYKHLPKIQKEIVKDLKANGYIKYDPKRLVGLGFFITFAFYFIVFSFLLPMSTNYTQKSVTMIALIGAAISGFLSTKMGRLNLEKGIDARWELKGLYEYMKTAEAERFKFGEMFFWFEKLLPYAISMGLINKWAGIMKEIYTQPPDWYESSSPTFNAMAFSSSISGMASSMTRDVASRPGGSSSGGSGFSGGSSGGGGGGGGGGSW